MASISETIGKGLGYLRSVQQADGSFTGSSSATVKPFRPVYTYQTTFLPALILNALATIPGSATIRQPLARWLAAQRSPTWSFNYWAANAPERQTMPYPDDLDDTFCSLIALQRHDSKLIDAAALGAIVKLLLATEAEVGGPYRTWLADDTAPAVWRDVDLAVNCNIAYFLTLVAEPLPNLTALMDRAIATGTFQSPYYPSAWPVLYYLARAYRGQHTPALVHAVHSQPARSALGHALRAAALLHLDQSAKSDVQALQRLQRSDGSWPAEAFCLDAKRQAAVHYHGSAGLTTALALEALQLQRDHEAAASNTAVAPTPQQRILDLAVQQFSGLDDDLRSHCTAMVTDIVAHDTSGEICLLPRLVVDSLRVNPFIPPATLDRLCLANVYGWMAYTIYDMFLDGEGVPALLPAAGVALRASLGAFSVVEDSAFQASVQQTFDIIDAANTWEVLYAHCTVKEGRIHLAALPRYGTLGRLADRSLGHSLTPLAVLQLAGTPAAAMQQVTQALRHYLIARQLLDDIRDWEDDIRAGRLTPVVADILRAARQKPGTHLLSAILPRLQQLFWHEILPTACTRIARQLAAARAACRESELFNPDSPLFELFSRLETMVSEVRAEHAETAQFMAAYKKPLT